MYNTRLQCTRCACTLGTWLTRPFHDDNRRQSVFIYARSYQSIQREKTFTSFLIQQRLIEYWLPSVEITRRHDRMVGSVLDATWFTAWTPYLLSADDVYKYTYSYTYFFLHKGNMVIRLPRGPHQKRPQYYVKKGYGKVVSPHSLWGIWGHAIRMSL